MMERIVKKEKPRLFDLAVSFIQDSLAKELAWLDHILPCAERLVKHINGKRIYTPNIYVGANEYEQILPDADGIGNYSFFVLSEPQETSHDVGGLVKVRCTFSLIVSLDIRTVDVEDIRDRESVKLAILRALKRTWMRHGSFTVSEIYERAENVFKGFSTDEIDNQYLMQPYCGFRFAGKIEIEEDCEL